MRARRDELTSIPKPPCEISWFWQKTHLSGQPEKKMAPDPDSPEMGGSSQKWRAERATRSAEVAPQKPRAACDLAAWHRRGHSSHLSYASGVMPSPRT
jgi:hypothetical protein